MTKRTRFRTVCPYCRSFIDIKVGRRLVFTEIYSEDEESNNIRKYHKVPLWKCSACKNKFAVDMYSQKAISIEEVPQSKNWYYSLITEEDLEK